MVQIDPKKRIGIVNGCAEVVLMWEFQCFEVKVTQSLTELMHRGSQSLLIN